MPSARLYDTIGAAYALTRRTEPRIAERVWAALGMHGRLLNVGAGTGSYEPSDRDVSPCRDKHEAPNGGVRTGALAPQPRTHGSAPTCSACEESAAAIGYGAGKATVPSTRRNAGSKRMCMTRSFRSIRRYASGWSTIVPVLINRRRALASTPSS